MKKLTAVLAIVMVLAICIAACGTEKEPSDTSTKAPQSTTTAEVTTTVPSNPGGDVTTTGDEGNVPVPDTDGMIVDGNLSDWANTDTIAIVGSGDYEGKKATFYAKLTDIGLYLACDAYHDTYTTTAGQWWENCNFEIFLGTANQQTWISAMGMSDENDACATEGKITSAKMITEALEDKATAYHTISEVFITAENLPENSVVNGAIRVGVAWKTVGDRCNNCGNSETDDWWTPMGVKTNDHPDANQAVVTANGIYTKEGYTAKYADMFFGINSEWSYVTGTGTDVAAPEGWPKALPADAKKGNAPFGNRAWGNTNLWGTTDNPGDGTQTNAYIWVLREFTVEDLSALAGKALYTNMFYDDTMELYINGTLVFEDKDNTAWNDGYETYCITEDASTLLVEGTNVIAISLQQHTGGYEFDMNLYIATADLVTTAGKEAVYAPAA